jgi:large subunit ribosomal protein L11
MSYVTRRIRLTVPANKAKPSPAIGQALGSLGINMMKFCKDFNAATTKYLDDLPMRVRLHSYNDGSYTFTTHLPHSSYYLKKSAMVESGAHATLHETAGIVHVKQIYELAKLKQKDHPELELTPLPSIFRSIVHTCKSMGFNVDFATETELKQRKEAEEKEKLKAEAAAVKNVKGKKK